MFTYCSNNSIYSKYITALNTTFVITTYQIPTCDSNRMNIDMLDTLNPFPVISILLTQQIRC
jgi:hypothetical protein